MCWNTNMGTCNIFWVSVMIGETLVSVRGGMINHEAKAGKPLAAMFGLFLTVLMVQPVYIFVLTYLMWRNCDMALGWDKICLMVLLFMIIAGISVYAFFFFCITFEELFQGQNHHEIFLPKAHKQFLNVWRKFDTPELLKEYQSFDRQYRYLYQGFSPAYVLMVYKLKVYTQENPVPEVQRTKQRISKVCCICEETATAKEEVFVWRKCRHLNHWSCFAKRWQHLEGKCAGCSREVHRSTPDELDLQDPWDQVSTRPKLQ